MKTLVSIAIVVKNGLPTLEKCLDSIRCTEEITIILDRESSDGTREFLQSRNLHVIEHEWLGFGKQHQLATQHCREDWVFKLDSDEMLSPELNHFLEHFNPNADTEIYTFRRKNFVAGQWIKGSGWWPDRVRRLFNRKQSSFTDDEVHETIHGEHETLIEEDAHIDHDAYQKLDDFIDKVGRYSSLRAKDMYKRGKQSSLFSALSHGFFAFIQSYILRKGFRDGYWGLVIAFSTSSVAFLKYMKLIELHRQKGSSES